MYLSIVPGSTGKRGWAWSLFGLILPPCPFGVNQKKHCIRERYILPPQEISAPVSGYCTLADRCSVWQQGPRSSTQMITLWLSISQDEKSSWAWILPESSFTSINDRYFRWGNCAPAWLHPPHLGSYTGDRSRATMARRKLDSNGPEKLLLSDLPSAGNVSLSRSV